MAHRVVLAIATALIFAFAGCSAGGRAPVPYVAGGDNVETVGDAADALTGPGPTGSELARTAIHATNALGSAMRGLSAAMLDRTAQTFEARGETAGRCTDGAEFFAPDRKGDPDSTELRLFYDAGCSRLAVDATRFYTPTGSQSEAVSSRVGFYAAGKPTATATLIDSASFTSSDFDRYGFPVASSGFRRENSSRLSIAGTRRVVAGSEFIMPPGLSQRFCQGSAGFGAPGIAYLDAAFGWQGATLSSGTTRGSGDTLEWSATLAQSAIQGAIGSLSLAAGTPAASCPLSAPAYTVQGGAPLGTLTLPIHAAFAHGRLANLAVRHAALAGGYTLSVTANRHAGDLAEVNGILVRGNARIANFRVDAFGSGTLTIAGTGSQYRIVDWIVVGT